MSDATAQLIADGGAAAAGDHLFRSPAFLAAEGTTHTLLIESPRRITSLPLIVREVPGSDLVDGISPYGYPGGCVEGPGPPPDSSAIEWAAAGLLSVFVRDRLGEPSLAGGRERSSVQVYEPDLGRRVRRRLVEQVRAAERAGWLIERTSGPDAGEEAIAGFEAAYEQTMRRTEAAPRYFFDRAYLDSLLAFEQSWLVLARTPQGAVGAAAIAARSDRHLHYFLGGTADASLAASPFKNVVVGMLDLADELGLPLNLGGGLAPGDGLERFKRGFANTELPFRTHEIVCDRDEYARLSGSRRDTGFFPVYRTP